MKFVKQSCGGFSLWAALAAVIFVAPGCAYYNTFYNTKKFYKEALEEKKRRTGDKPTPAEIQKYDKTIEKASKVLQIHPNSKYVDDALIILGECFYYKQEYLKAQRKFQELITIFPKSNLVARAQLWLGKTNIELKDYAGAEGVLKELQQKEKKGEYFHQAQYFLGEIYFRQQQYVEATKEFEAVVGKLGEAKMRGEAYMRLGECYVSLQKFDLAAEAFRRAEKNAQNNIDFLFQARLKRASALKNYGRYDDALSVLNGMLKEFSTHRELSLVKLEVAECTLLQGKVETAVKLYTDLIQNHQRTEASAAAYFALGEIYERRFGDFAKAKESFDNVRRENARSEKVAEAESRSKAISEFLKIKQTIASLLKQIETQAGESVAPLAANDTPKEVQRTSNRRAISRIPDRRSRRAAATSMIGASTASAEAPTDLQGLRKISAELAKNKILLAELYLFHFDRPDSAMREYLDVFEFFPQTEYAPQAMYSLAYILSKSPAAVAMHDSVMRVLADKYGHTAQGLAAKRQMGLADTKAASYGASSLFYEAENYLFSKKDPQRALGLYQQFWQSQPNSKLAPQSLYAIGWIYEHTLYDNQQALAAYKKLIEKYPDSPFAQQLRPRLAAIAQQQAPPPTPETVAPAAAPQVQAETQAVPELLDDEELSMRQKNAEQQNPVTDEEELEVSIKKTNEDKEKVRKDKEQPPPLN